MDYQDTGIVRERKGKFASVLEIEVHKADMGKVIGKRGATIHVRFHGMSVTIPGFLLDFPAAPCS